MTNEFPLTDAEKMIRERARHPSFGPGHSSVIRPSSSVIPSVKEAA
jgi:hypothetical protein